MIFSYLMKNFADGKTSSGDELSVILKNLGHDMKIVLRWLNLNSRNKWTKEKFSLWFLGNSYSQDIAL